MTDFLMYYSGHGSEKNGSWIVSMDPNNTDILNLDSSRVHIDNVLDMFQESGFTGNVEISSDSCYSGQVCFIAKTWWERQQTEGVKLHMSSLKVAGTTHRSL